MRDIRWIALILVFFLMPLLLTGCCLEGCTSWGDRLERTYIEVIIDEDSPPVFRFSKDEEFRAPVKVTSIKVYSKEERTKSAMIRWYIVAIDQEIPLREVVYGVVPDGFKEDKRALPLKPGAKYVLYVFRGGGIHFINKPGRYNNYSHLKKDLPN